MSEYIGDIVISLSFLALMAPLLHMLQMRIRRMREDREDARAAKAVIASGEPTLAEVIAEPPKSSLSLTREEIEGMAKNIASGREVLGDE